jgi:thiosulfate dehydrogenase [quinone] large subunit
MVGKKKSRRHCASIGILGYNTKMEKITIEDSPAFRFLFTDRRIAWLWLIVRIYVGWQWFIAGLEKIQNPAWVGTGSGKALAGFIKAALAKTAGSYPDVQGWYGAFLQNFVAPHPVFWSHLVAYGELLVGIGLIVGALTGIAAFFGLFMNLNYMLAGTVSTNPILFSLSIGIVLAWRVAGYLGADRFLLPLLGAPWQPGSLFNQPKPKSDQSANPS